MRGLVVGGRVETGTFPPFLERASALIDLSDEFTIDGDISDPVTGTATLTVSGRLAAGALPSDCQFCSALTDVLAELIISDQPASIPHIDVETWTLHTEQPGDPGSQLIVSETLSVPFEITSEKRSFGLRALLILHTYGAGSFADFSNTAFLSLDLPDGLTFTSASGALLSDPVPEPDTLLLMALGLLSLFAASRRRAKR